MTSTHGNVAACLFAENPIAPADQAPRAPIICRTVELQGWTPLQDEDNVWLGMVWVNVD